MVTWTRATLVWLAYAILATGWLLVTVATGTETAASGIERLSNRLRFPALLFGGIAVYYAGLPGGFVLLRAVREGRLADRTDAVVRRRLVLALEGCTAVLGCIVAAGLVLFSYPPRGRRFGNTINLAEIMGIETVGPLTGHRTTLLLIVVLVLWTLSTAAGTLLLNSPTDN